MVNDVNWQYNLIIVWLILAGFTSAGLAVYGWRHSSTVWTKAYVIMMASAAWWTLTYTYQVILTDLDQKILLNNLQLTVSNTIGVSWLAFALQYTNRDRWVNKKTMWAMMAIPIFTIIFGWTDGWQHLYRQEIILNHSGLFTILNIHHGPVFWLQLYYSYLCVALGIGFLIHAYVSWSQPYKGQAFVLLLAATVPLLANVITNFDLFIDLPAIDLTPFAFNATGIVMAWGLFRFDMLKIEPVARDAIFTSINDGVIVLDNQNRVADINPAAERIFNQPREKIIGSSAQDAFQRWDYLAQRYRGVIEVQEEIIVDNEVYDLQIAPLYSRAGQISGRLVMLHNITQRKQSELQLLQAKQAADAARQTAEIANAAKSEFLANVSHELRTPLTAILGFARMVQKRLDERILPQLQTDDRRTQRAINQVNTNLGIILTEGQRLTTMINQVLDLQKIESGKMDWHLQPVHFAEIIEQATAATATLFSHKRLTLLKEIPPHIPAIQGDKDKLVQVVINLIANAVKFTAQGTITCRVSQQTAEVQVSIIDTGIGIAAADLPQIFEKFQQVGNALTDKPQGTGLGLAICQQIVLHHGGRIWVESTPGQGSTFSFALPCETETAPL